MLNFNISVKGCYSHLKCKIKLSLQEKYVFLQREKRVTLMRKKFIIVILCATWALTSVAQDWKEELIGNEYREVKAWIALMDERFPAEGIPPEWYELTVRENLPGTGPHREVTRMYWGELPTEDEGEIYPPHFLRLATEEYNFAAREFYEEYLYDEDGNVLFIYALTPDVSSDMVPVYELRMWFDGKRLLRFTAQRAKGLDYIDLETLRKASFLEEFSGESIPEKFRSETDRLLDHSQELLKLFKIIDNR